MEPLKYPYKPKPFIMFLCFVFFAVCSAVLGMKALQNDSGLILYRVITLSKQGADIFYWVMVALSFGMSAIGVYVMVRSLQSTAELIIAKDHIVAPVRMGKSSVKILFSEVTNLRTMSVSGQHFLEITHSYGKVSLQRRMFQNKAIYNEVVDLITQRVG